MDVLFVTVSNGRERFNTQSTGYGLDLSAQNERYTRIALGGRVEKGRSGIVLDLIDQKIGGHKLEGIPSELLDYVRHFSLDDMRVGLQAAARGEDVFIGAIDQGVLIQWTGPGFKAYGAGEDSE